MSKLNMSLRHRLISFGPLPIRIIAGTAFIAHGLPKLANVVGTEAFFASKTKALCSFKGFYEVGC